MKLKKGEVYKIKTSSDKSNIITTRKMIFLREQKTAAGKMMIFQSKRVGYLETYTELQWIDCVCYTLDGECVNDKRVKVTQEQEEKHFRDNPANS